MSEHTPGPWEWDGDHNTRQELRAPASENLDDRCVFTPECYAGESFIENLKEADARLIAAAPRLLQELKELQKELADFRDEILHDRSELFVEDGTNDRLNAILHLFDHSIDPGNELAAAIAAAEGE